MCTRKGHLSNFFFENNNKIFSPGHQKVDNDNQLHWSRQMNSKISLHMFCIRQSKQKIDLYVCLCIIMKLTFNYIFTRNISKQCPKYRCSIQTITDNFSVFHWCQVLQIFRQYYVNWTKSNAAQDTSHIYDCKMIRSVGNEFE